MNALIKENTDRIRHLCRQHHIHKLWVFGSVLTDTFSKESDVDFLYEMADQNLNDQEYYHAFWGFMDELRALLQREIDLIWYGGIRNPYFKEEVDETKVLIYDKESEKVFV